MPLHTNKAVTRLSLLNLAVLILPLLHPSFAGAATPFERSEQLIEQGKHTEARRALESELRIRPENVEARYNLAILMTENGHTSDAISLYEKNLAIAWHLPSLVNLASALQKLGETKKVQQWLEKGTKKLRHEATPWYLLAAISEQRGNIVQAMTQYQRALKADPLNGFAHLHYATFQSRHQLADHGLKHGRKATKLLPECAPCWREYGNILRREKNEQEAMIAYQRSLAINPNKQTRQQLVDTMRQLGFHQRASQVQRGINLKSK